MYRYDPRVRTDTAVPNGSMEMTQQFTVEHGTLKKDKAREALKKE